MDTRAAVFEAAIVSVCVVRAVPLVWNYMISDTDIQSLPANSVARFFKPVAR